MKKLLLLIPLLLLGAGCRQQGVQPVSKEAQACFDFGGDFYSNDSDTCYEVTTTTRNFARTSTPLEIGRGEAKDYFTISTRQNAGIISLYIDNLTNCPQNCPKFIVDGKEYTSKEFANILYFGQSSIFISEPLPSDIGAGIQFATDTQKSVEAFFKSQYSKE
jgi:hypothetical protein